MKTNFIQTKNRYPSGLKHIHCENSLLNQVYIGFTLNVGSKDEDESSQYGAAHFLEHILFYGSKNFPNPLKTREYLLSLGATLNASTNVSETNYYMIAPISSLMSCFEVMYDRIFNPLIQEEDVEKERGIILSERRVRDSKVISIMEDKIMEVIYEDSLYSHPIVGYKESIEEIDQKLLLNFYKRFYTVTNCTVVTLGGFGYVKAKETLEKVFEQNQIDLYKENAVIGRPVVLLSGDTKKLPISDVKFLSGNLLDPHLMELTVSGGQNIFNNARPFLLYLELPTITTVYDYLLTLLITTFFEIHKPSEFKRCRVNIEGLMTQLYLEGVLFAAEAERYYKADFGIQFRENFLKLTKSIDEESFKYLLNSTKANFLSLLTTAEFPKTSSPFNYVSIQTLFHFDIEPKEILEGLDCIDYLQFKKELFIIIQQSKIAVCKSLS